MSLSFDFLARAMEDASLRKERCPPAKLVLRINELMGPDSTIIAKYDPALVPDLQYGQHVTPDDARVQTLKGKVFVHLAVSDLPLYMKALTEADTCLILLHGTSWVWIAGYFPEDIDVIVINENYPFHPFDPAHRKKNRDVNWKPTFLYRQVADSPKRANPFASISHAVRLRSVP